jgi:hypothetical protein
MERSMKKAVVSVVSDNIASWRENIIAVFSMGAGGLGTSIIHTRKLSKVVWFILLVFLLVKFLNWCWK